MFFKKKPINSDEYKELSRRISMLEIDLSLLVDRVEKAVKRKVIKRTEEPQEEKSINGQIVPM